MIYPHSSASIGAGLGPLATLLVSMLVRPLPVSRRVGIVIAAVRSPIGVRADKPAPDRLDRCAQLVSSAS